MPDTYATAVKLDEKAELHDALSTAYHFSQNNSRMASEYLAMQRQQAEAAASSVSLSVSLPFTMPRWVYAMAALAVAASILTGLRYSTGHGLDLQRPITEVLFEDQNAARPKLATKAKNAVPGEWSEQARDMLSKLGIKPEASDAEPGEQEALNKALEQALQPNNQPNDMNQPGGKGAGDQGKKDGAMQGDKNNTDPVDGGDKGGEDQEKGGNNASNKKDGNGKDSPGKEGDNQQGLLSKLKNAVSSMLKTTTPNESSTPQSSDKKAPSNDKKDPSKQTGPGQGTPEQSNGDQQTEETDPNGDAMGGQKGKSNDTTASKTPQKQEGTGIGLADGVKDIKAAEQLKAMGKISEIIGKRAADVSGETMVEVESGKQQLKTQYSTTHATHAETDGDVTRDQIPLGLQSYVQQYFSEVHKGDAAAAKAPQKK
jgi:hypothetical protein